jgi:hypothetical protein
MRSRPKVPKQIRRFLGVVGIGVFVLLAVAPGASAATIAGDPLTIYADGLGHMQVRFTGETVGEFDPASQQLTSAGLTLDLGHGFPCGSSGNAPTNVTPAATSGSGTDGDPFQITTRYDCTSLAHVSVQQTLSYVNGEDGMLAEYAIKNEGSGDAVFRVLAWGNLHHAQTTLGQGFYLSGAPRVVGAYNDAQGSEAGLVQAASTWNAFMEGEATHVFWTASGLFGPDGADNTIDPTLQDDAVAVQFDDYNSFGLAAGASHTFSVIWYFARYDGLSLDSASQQRTTGETARFTATSLNHGPPVQGATERYSVAGANPGTGAVTTRADGTAAIAVPGANAGADTLSTYVDVNSNGSEDPDETVAQATIKWTAAAVTVPPVTVPVTTPPPPDYAGAIRTGLKAAQARINGLKRGSLLRGRGFKFAFTAPGAGVLTGQITVPAARGGAAAKTRVLAKLTRLFGTAGKAQVQMKLTAAGVKALKRSRRLKASLSLTFKPSSGTAATAHKAVVLRR